MCGFIGAISKNNIDDSKIQEADKFLECRGLMTISGWKN